MIRYMSLLIAVCILTSCNSSDLEDAIDLIDGPSRKSIDTSIMGVNAFVNDLRFGSVASQFLELRDTLRISHARVLFLWDDGAHSSPDSPINFSRTDEVIASLPKGMDALIIMTGLPSWMSNSANWIDGNPRKTFIEKWFKPIVQRYGSNPRISGWQVWNEPNMASNSENAILKVADNAENYVEMLALAYSVAKDITPSKLVVNAATTAINQNFPETRNYNRKMRDAGAEDFLDIWAVHYYGEQFENVIRDGGVADFLNGLSKPIWITESGARGINAQLAYVEKAWPYLQEKIERLDRIYYYQFTEDSAPESTYGLRNPSPTERVSDLYIYLRDR